MGAGLVFRFIAPLIGQEALRKQAKMTLLIHLLGPARISCDGNPVEIPGHRPLALLAYLLVTGKAHSRQHLVDLLFEIPDDPRAALRWTLTKLRKAIGKPYLVADRQQIGFDFQSDYWLDVAAFEAGELDLYQGDFLEGLHLRDARAFEDWVFFERERLRSRCQAALTERLVGYESQGDDAAAIETAFRLLWLDNLREDGYRALMRAYARSGRREAALAQYAQCRQVLQEELGIPPAPETTALYVRIRSGEEIAREPEAPPSAWLRLPIPPTPFVGREADLAEIARRLRDPNCRLLTLLGPGGIGKTRLALQVAQEVAAAHTDQTGLAHGVFFVPLAPVSAIDGLLPTLAGVLGCSFSGRTDPKRQLLDFLRRKGLLLVLDNLEHLLEGVELVSEILASAPGVKMLVTSHEALNLQGEWVYAVRGMRFPASDQVGVEDRVALADYDAVALFLQSAQRVRGDFTFGTDDIAALTRICRLVDGLPLALELAAGWVDVLSLAEIAAEVQRGLDFLETDLRDVPARHRSVRAVFDQTWGRLSRAERDVLRRFSVFRGGCARDAAQAVTGASLRTLAALSNKSLIQYRRAGGRYQMQELLRQYAAEKLAADPEKEAASNAAHSAFYCTALGRWDADLKSARKRTAADEIEMDYQNVHVAWTRAVEGANLGHLAMAANGLGEFYLVQGRWSEGEAAFRMAASKLQALHDPTTVTADAARLLARLLAWQVCMNWAYYSIYEEHQAELLRQGLTLLAHPALAEHDTRAEDAFIRQQLGHIMRGAASREQVAQGRGHLEASLRLYRGLGDDVGAADVLYELGIDARHNRAPERARRLLSESLMLLRRTGEPLRMARSLVELGRAYRDLLAFDQAREEFEQAYSVSQAAGQLLGMENARRRAATQSWFLGEFDAALRYLEDALALAHRADSQRLIALDLWFIGLTHAYRGQFARALALMQESVVIDPFWEERTKVNMAFAHIHAGQYEAGRALVGEIEVDEGTLPATQHLIWRLLGWTALAEEQHAEALVALQRSVALCCALPGWIAPEWHAWTRAPLGRTLHGLGRHGEAQQELHVALQTCVEIRAFLPLMHLMPIIPVLLADAGDVVLKERAVELYALAQCIPFVANSQLFEDIAGQHIRASSADLAPEVVAATRQRGRGLDLWETAAELLEELTELGWGAGILPSQPSNPNSL